MKESEYSLSYQMQKFVNKTAKKTYTKARYTRVCTWAIQLYSVPKVQKILTATPQFGRSEASSNSYFITFSSAFCSRRHHTCYTLTRTVRNKAIPGVMKMEKIYLSFLQIRVIREGALGFLNTMPCSIKHPLYWFSIQPVSIK